MLKFCRTKFVGYEKKDNNLRIYGTLDDTIYSMQIDINVKLPELEVDFISGKMRRVTTPFCNEAQQFLQQAIGLKVEPGFQSKVKRLIGRPGCRHYGNLINECLESIIPGLVTIKYKEMLDINSDITIIDAIEELMQVYPQIKDFSISKYETGAGWFFECKICKEEKCVGYYSGE